MRGNFGPRPITATAQRVFDAYQSGLSMRAVAALCGVTVQRVAQIIPKVARRLGVAVRKTTPRSPDSFPRTVISPDLIDAWQSRRLTIDQLAEHLEIHPNTAYNALHRQQVRRERRPSQNDLLYAAYRAGATIPELAVRFGFTKSRVSVGIDYARKRDPNPYYRYPPHRRKLGLANGGRSG